MDKKKLYWIGGIIIIVLGYLNYFKEESTPKIQEKKIETTDAKYLGEGFEIEAKKQIDFVDKKENQFVKAKAKVKEMVLTGDNAFLDAARNLALKTNVLGMAPNGWNFKADEINYDKLKDEFSSDKLVEAENKNLKIKVSGNNFKTDSKMTYIVLKKGVTVENDKIKVTGDEADYKNSDKVAVMKGNIQLEGKATEGKTSELTGEFTTLNFDMNSDVLKSDEPFKINYGNAVLSAGEFTYNQSKDTLDIRENVIIQSGNFKTKVERIEKRSGSSIYDIVGEISGTDGIYSFKSERGEYNPETEELILIGNVKIISVNKQELTAEVVNYNVESGIAVAKGKNRNANYIGPEGELSTKEFSYDTKNGILKIEEKFNFKTKEYSGTGTGLTYNQVSKNGVMKDAIVITGTKRFKTSIIDFAEEKIKFPEEFSIEDSKASDRLVSKNGIYDLTSKIFKTEESFTLSSGNSIINGIGIEYNDMTGMGITDKEITVQNQKDKLYLTGEKAEFKNGEYLDILGDVKITLGNYKTAAEKARYTFIDETVRIPQKIDIVSEKDAGRSQMTDPVIELGKKLLMGKKFMGQNEKYKAVADEINYEYDSEILDLKGNAMIEEGETALRGNHLKYSVKNEKMSALGKYEMKYGDINGNGENISLENIIGEIKGGKIHLTTSEKEEFQADKVDGNLNKGVVDFIGNARGKSFNDGKLISYRGDLLRAHLQKNGNRYSAERIELIGDSTISQEGMTLYSKHGDLNLLKETAVATGGVRAVMLDEKKVETEVKSEKAFFNMKTNILDLTGGVIVTSIDPKKGKTVATGEKGKVNRNSEIIELEGNVIIDSPEAVVKSDTAKYNMKTKKINATGNVVVDYKVKP